MSERIHDGEPDTGEAVARALLEAQCPDWAGADLHYLDSTSGTSNALWKATLAGGSSAVVRLPRTPGAASSVELECRLLPVLGPHAASAGIRVPAVLHAGHATEGFPHSWAVFDWIDGDDAWAARASIGSDSVELAEHVGAVVAMLGRLRGMPVAARVSGSRGGPLGPLLERLDRWLDDPQWRAAERLDIAAIRRLAAESAEVFGEPVPTGFVHGDLIPGNLLVEPTRVVALIDWGGAAIADLAQDLSPAWSIFEGSARDAFRASVGASDSAWLRGRAFDLEQAVGGVLYYVPRRHPLGDVMARTLERILAEA